MNIQTPHAILRSWKTGDAESLTRYANNPRIASSMRDGFPSPYTRDDADRFIATAGELNKSLFLAIEVDGQAAGGIGVHCLDDVYQHTAEIGYWLAESFWGRGIITDAVRAIVPVAFEFYPIRRLQAGVFSNNLASMRVLEIIGFIREAIHSQAITKNSQVLDEVMYVRFKNWEESKNG